MKRPVTLKLFTCYLGFSLFSFGLLNIAGSKYLKKSLLEKQKNVLYNEASVISSEYTSQYYDNQLSLEFLNKHLRSVDTFINSRIWLVNHKGDVVLDTRESPLTASLNINEISPDFLYHSFSIDTKLSGILSDNMLSVVHPISSNYSVIGYIVMHYSLDDLEENHNSLMLLFNFFLIIILFVLLLLFLYLNHVTVRPLRKLTVATHEYTSGNFSFPLVLKSKDEYKELADAISYMVGELNSLDEYQKNFIANVSHDFRSPLTSIKGYAEAILDGTIPVEMQNKYLDIIVFETERLNKLTKNLLTLNSFDNKRALLDITSFDINKVIKHTAESFEGVCTKRKIILNLEFSEKETFVFADNGKIQQVLYNLIDNAVKFSSDGSGIDISTDLQNEKVLISVKDHGTGIPKESIRKIWERFYKTDPSRGRDKKGTGLGLSITKEIISAHKENINVISTEGIGTEFIFTLPAGENPSEP